MSCWLCKQTPCKPGCRYADDAEQTTVGEAASLEVATHLEGTGADCYWEFPGCIEIHADDARIIWGTANENWNGDLYRTPEELERGEPAEVLDAGVSSDCEDPATIAQAIFRVSREALGLQGPITLLPPREPDAEPEPVGEVFSTGGYRRVLPRDLFNEAKLLKGLGQLSLLIHEGQAPGLSLELDAGTETEGFLIEQDPSDGGLYCSNLQLRRGEEVIPLRTALNSREPYPLRFGWDGVDPVFNDDGSLSEEFRAAVLGTGR